MSDPAGRHEARSSSSRSSTSSEKGVVVSPQPVPAHQRAARTTPPPPATTRPQAQSRGNSTASSNGGARAGERSPGAAGAASRPRLKQKDTMNGPLYMQTSTTSNVVLVRRPKKKDEGTWRLLARLFVENQIGLSFNLLSLLFLAHACIPKARPTTHKFFSLSYYNAASEKYGNGFDDVFLTFFFVLLFTGLRAGTMEYILAPIGKWRGIKKRKDLTRFSEQAWMLLYYMVFWSLGLYIYASSKYFMNMEELWSDWPDREMKGLMKGYLLGQLAFWFQQILVINMEERRKDHWQMLSHHIITIGLISACYSYHHSKVGNLILVLMDVVDLFLPLAKCFKYLGFTKLCDATFGIFMISWLIPRHIFYPMVIWSVYADSPRLLPTGCFRGSNEDLTGPFPAPPGRGYLAEPFFDARGTVCYDERVKWAFLGPLMALEVMMVLWFFMIVRVAIRVIRGDGADDVRSDGEEEDDDDEEEEEEEEYEGGFLDAEADELLQAPLEEEVGVDEINLKNWERRTGVKRQATSTGVNIPGHSDRKELLGRIGCEKQVE